MRDLNEYFLTAFNFNDRSLRVLAVLFSITAFLFLASLQGSYAVGANSSSNSSFNTSGYSISILDNSIGGNVQNNTEIKQYIPKTNLSDQIFEMTKQGSVVLKFGDGNGPKLLISAGIHGNEPEANIAVMKYLEYIKDQSFTGTLYVIPFDIPRDTAQNCRDYKGQDPNRIADIPGTPGWNIVKFAQNQGISYILDVHSGAQVPPNGHIYINSASTTQENAWVSYVKSQTSCSSGVDGADSPGMVRVFAHNNGINSMTLEVERDSTPTVVAAEAELKMIIAAAKYLGFPGYTNSGPHIISTNPAADATGVPLTTSPVNITFSENITAGTNYSGIYIKNLNTGSTVSVASKTINGNVLTITQTYNRLKDCLYQVYLPAGSVKDAAGNILASAYTYKYSTSSLSTDRTPPTVTGTNPASNAIGVPLTTSPVSITFSENIVAGSNYSGIYIKNLNTGSTVSVASKTINGNVLTITQTYNRLKDCLYQVYLPAGSVKDAAGNILASAYTYKYSTSSLSTDRTPPTVTGTNPVSNATGVALNSPVTITFSENITAGTNYTGIYLKNTISGAVASMTKSISGNVLTIQQTTTRVKNTPYQVYIPAGAIKDTTGNSLAAAYTYNFTTVSGTTDTTPPTVTSTNPASNSTKISLTSPVTLTFSENILAGANISGIYIKNLITGKNVTIGSKTISGNTLTIQQASSRLSKNTYQVYIPAGAVKDTAGNSLAAAYTYQFQTV